MPVEQAGGVVVRIDPHARFLVVTAKNESSRWVLPKGHIEAGESPAQAAVREVREEAGVVARVRVSVGDVRFSAQGTERHVEFFLMDYVGETASDDGRVVAWVSFDEAVARLSTDESRQVVIRANQALAARG